MDNTEIKNIRNALKEEIYKRFSNYISAGWKLKIRRDRYNNLKACFVYPEKVYAKDICAYGYRYELPIEISKYFYIQNLTLCPCYYNNSDSKIYYAKSLYDYGSFASGLHPHILPPKTIRGVNQRRRACLGDYSYKSFENGSDAYKVFEHLNISSMVGFFRLFALLFNDSMGAKYAATMEIMKYRYLEDIYDVFCKYMGSFRPENGGTILFSGDEY